MVRVLAHAVFTFLNFAMGLRIVTKEDSCFSLFVVESRRIEAQKCFVFSIIIPVDQRFCFSLPVITFLFRHLILTTEGRDFGSDKVNVSL